METQISRDTVIIDESVHSIYKELTDGTDPITVPFKTMKDVFLWAACMGYKQGERRPIAGKKLTIFRWAQFNPQTDIPVIKAIALADTTDINVLLSQENMLNIIEEYANAGIHALRSILYAEYQQPLWKLTDIMREIRSNYE